MVDVFSFVHFVHSQIVRNYYWHDNLAPFDPS